MAQIPIGYNLCYRFDVQFLLGVPQPLVGRHNSDGDAAKTTQITSKAELRCQWVHHKRSRIPYVGEHTVYTRSAAIHCPQPNLNQRRQHAWQKPNTTAEENVNLLTVTSDDTWEPSRKSSTNKRGGEKGRKDQLLKLTEEGMQRSNASNRFLLIFHSMTKFFPTTHQHVHEFVSSCLWFHITIANKLELMGRKDDLMVACLLCPLHEVPQHYAEQSHKDDKHEWDTSTALVATLAKQLLHKTYSNSVNQITGSKE